MHIPVELNEMGSAMRLLNRIFNTQEILQTSPSAISEQQMEPAKQFSEDEKRFYRSIQLISSQTAQLSRQIFRALEAQQSFLSEIGQRTVKLDTE